jgi:lysophospholipase L1-like esterase
MYNGEYTASPNPAYLVTAAGHGIGKDHVGEVWYDEAGETGNAWNIEYVTTNTVKIFAFGSQTLNESSGAGTLNKSGESNIDFTANTVETMSPLWNDVDDKIDFAYWAARNIPSYDEGVVDLDVVYVLLGWNSVEEPNQTDWDDYMVDVELFLDTLHSDIPGTIVRIVGIQAPSNTGGLGDDYASDNELGQYYGVLKSANNLNEAYQELVNKVEYSSWVEFVSLAPQFDSDYNMATTSTDVNTRNTTKELIGNNGLHPSDDGHEQIADAVYRKFVTYFLN